MKRLSGEFLSRLLLVVQQANQREMTGDELRALLMQLVDGDNVYIDIPDLSPTDVASAQPAPRMATVDDASLHRLNALLPWSSFAALGSRGTLGMAWSPQKRGKLTRYPDAGVEKLHGHISLTGKSVLELGCFEGHHSISLARHAGEVWAVDGRLENVIKTLVRVWLAGMERKVSVNFLDLEHSTLKQQLAALGRTAPFDLLHHRGVLYHLSDPVANLVQCAEVVSHHLYLHTQIAEDDQATQGIEYLGERYDVFRYREAGVDFAPFAGITPYAHWLTQSSLERLLRNIGFPRVNVLARVQERNGPRLELIASR